MLRKWTAVLLIILLFSGCTTQQAPEVPPEKQFNESPSEVIYNPPERSEVLLYAVRPDTRNPLLTAFSANRAMFSLIYEPLVSVNQDFSIACRLAENFVISDNGAKLTLSLRQNIRWQDGSSFNAYDVDYTVKEILKNKDTCIYAQNLEAVKSSRAVNTYTYEFTLSAPDSGFINLLTFPIIKSSSVTIKDSIDNFSVNGTGMYEFAGYSDMNSITLTANPAWWGGKTNLQKITVNLLPDSASSYNGFKMDQMDIVVADSSLSGKYSLSDNIASVNANTNTYAYLSLNYGNALLNLPSIRKILKEIIHSANITKDIMPDFSIPCNSPVNPASQYAVAASQEPADIKGLLTEAGCVQDASGMRSIQVNGRSYPLSFDLLLNGDNPIRVITGEYIASAFSMYGIKLNLVKNTADGYLRAAQTGHYDMVLCETDIKLDCDFSFMLSSSGALNYGKFSMPEMDGILTQINAANDIASRAQLMQQFQTIFAEQMPQIPLYFANKKIYYNTKLLEQVTAGGIGNEYSTLAGWSMKSGKENES